MHHPPGDLYPIPPPGVSCRPLQDSFGGAERPSRGDLGDVESSPLALDTADKVADT